MRHAKFFTALLMFVTLARPLAAQDPQADPTRVAGIVAIVGDSVITSAFMVDATQRRVAELQQAQRAVPTTAAGVRALQDTVLNERIEELVILQHIMRDTTYKVDDANVSTVVDARFNQMQSQQGGPVKFQAALKASGLTAQDYRTLLASQVRVEALFAQFRERVKSERQAPKATEKEIAELFPAWQAARPARPALVAFQQIVMHVQPSDSALARAKAKADSIFLVLAKDRNAFPDLAKRLSDDKVSGEKGGEIGWFKQTDGLAREFVRTSFNYPAGTLAPPVRTEFGYHIIEIERRRGNEVQVRHILISPTVTEADIERSKARADSAAAKLRAGADIEQLVKEYGDPTEDLTVSGADIEQLKANSVIDLTTAAKGEIVGPTATPAGPGQRITIARVTETSPAGQWALNDPGVRDNIRAIIEDKKLLAEVVQEYRRKTYIDIRAH